MLANQPLHHVLDLGRVEPAIHMDAQALAGVLVDDVEQGALS